MIGKKKNVPAPAVQPGDPTRTTGRIPGPVVGTLVDKAQRLQRPAVTKYVAGIRRRHPDETPAQIIARLEKHFINTVTASGGAVGATAAIPGVGTVTAIGAMSAETVFFIEASALLALAIADVHGISPADTERRRTLVLGVALGEEGTAVIGKAIGARSSAALSSLPGIPGVNLATINKTLTNRFVRKFTVGKAPLMFGKVLPGGIGAVIGGVGNRALASAVVRNAREAFGPAPARWPDGGQIDGVVDGSVVDDAGNAGASVVSRRLGSAD